MSCRSTGGGSSGRREKVLANVRGMQASHSAKDGSFHPHCLPRTGVHANRSPRIQSPRWLWEREEGLTGLLAQRSLGPSPPEQYAHTFRPRLNRLVKMTTDPYRFASIHGQPLQQQTWIPLARLILALHQQCKLSYINVNSFGFNLIKVRY
jgi:hypothetical protein